MGCGHDIPDDDLPALTADPQPMITGCVDPVGKVAVCGDFPMDVCPLPDPEHPAETDLSVFRSDRLRRAASLPEPSGFVHRQRATWPPCPGRERPSDMGQNEERLLLFVFNRLKISLTADPLFLQLRRNHQKRRVSVATCNHRRQTTFFATDPRPGNDGNVS